MPSSPPPSPPSGLLGVDVNHYQGTINWSQVAATEPYAYMKATEGTTFDDPTFPANWAGAGAAGMYRGAYAFGHPNTDPVAAANYFLAETGSMTGSHDLPPVLDLETTDGQTPAAVAAWGLTWLHTVEAATQRLPILYTYPSFFTSSMGSPAGYGGFPLWIANYGVSSPAVPSAWTTWTFWQYSATGSVPGITGPVDTDTFNGSPSALAALAAARTGGPAVSITGASVVRPASGTTPLTFTVSLDHTATQAVSVHVQTSDGTALGLVDYTPTTTTATIAAGQTSTTVSVPIIGDQSDEPAKTFTVTLSNPTGGSLTSPSSATVTINDNDAAGSFSLSSASYNVNEDSGSITITVNRAGGASDGRGG